MISFGKRRASSILRKAHQSELREVEYWAIILEGEPGRRLMGLYTLDNILLEHSPGHRGLCPTKVAEDLRAHAWGGLFSESLTPPSQIRS